MTPDTPTPTPKPGALALAAIAACLLAIVIALNAAAPVLTAIVAPAPRDPLAMEEQAQRVATYNASFDTSRAQIDGRTMFFIPPEPPPKPAPKPEPRPREDPPPPPPPSKYGGPAIVAVVFDQVWFANGDKIRVGESKGDIEVLDNHNAPWTVTLRWKGVEFDAQVLERTATKLLGDDEQ